MPTRNSLVALFGILLVLAASGCTGLISGLGGGTTTSAGGSVTITSFTSDETNIEGNQKIALTMEIKNQGDSTARSVKAQLTTLDLACAQASCAATDTQWGLLNGQRDAVISDLKVVAVGEEAVPRTYTWRVQAPKLPANMVQTYDALARVSYSYSTETSRLIRIVSKDEYDSLKQAGQLPPVHTTVTSNGPIGIDVTVKEPIKIEDAMESFMLSITLKNLAGGTVYADNIDASSDRNKMWVKLFLTPGIGLLGSGDAECNRLVSDAKGLLAELNKGTFTIQCEFSSNRPIASIDKEIRIKAQYGYFSDSTVKITVTGKTRY
ncbi:MAG: hypothetical protein V1731_03170 [Candidatus Aenigmatarchaeota archaeon]